MKVSNHGGRLSLNEFEPADRVLINKAWGFYRCLISTEDAFPSHIKEMEFVQRAWKDACASVEADVQPHPDVIKLVSVYRCGEFLLMIPTDFATRLSNAWRGQDQNTPPCRFQLSLS
jgi:hypothetical protein